LAGGEGGKAPRDSRQSGVSDREQQNASFDQLASIQANRPPGANELDGAQGCRKLSGGHVPDGNTGLGQQPPERLPHPARADNRDAFPSLHKILVVRK